MRPFGNARERAHPAEDRSPLVFRSPGALRPACPEPRPAPRDVPTSVRDGKTNMTLIDSRLSLLAPCALTLSLAGFACGDDDTTDPVEEHTTEEEFCEHFVEGPFQAVSASALAATAPDAVFEHARVDVTLTATTSGYLGWVALTPDEETEIVLGVGSDMPVQLWVDGSTTAVEVEETTVGTVCAEVVRLYTFDVQPVKHVLRFGPTAEGTVSFGLEEAGHDHEH